MTDEEIEIYIEPFLKLNLKEKGNRRTIIKAIRRLVNAEAKK